MNDNNDNPLLDYLKTIQKPPSSSDLFSSFLPPIPPPKPRAPLNDFLGLPLIAPKPRGITLKIAPVPPKNKSELVNKVRNDLKTILATDIKIINARRVPSSQEIANNEAKEIITSVLHVDMRKSSQILELFDPITALRIYKAFHGALVSTARLKNGRIRTFAGDRIGVVFDFHQERQRSIAVETAIMMEEILQNVVNPVLLESIGYEIEFGIGVDFGQMYVGRIGQTGADNNDLAWVGTAMNRASKLADISEPGVYISNRVYQGMSADMKDNSMIWKDIRHQEYGLIHKWLLKI